MHLPLLSASTLPDFGSWDVVLLTFVFVALGRRPFWAISPATSLNQPSTLRSNRGILVKSNFNLRTCFNSITAGTTAISKIMIIVVTIAATVTINKNMDSLSRTPDVKPQDIVSSHPKSRKCMNAPVLLVGALVGFICFALKKQEGLNPEAETVTHHRPQK